MNCPVKSTLSLALLAASLLALGGCATGHYGCPAPNGVTCLSSTEVYEATNSAERVVGDDHGRITDERPAKSRTRAVEYGEPEIRAPRTRDTVIINRGALAFDVSEPPSRTVSLGQEPASSPVRTPPKVMRLWVASWEDDSGDLHLASSVFTEIQPRRWSVGEPGGLGATHLQLIQPLSGTPKSPESRPSQPTLSPVDAGPVSAERGGNG